MLESLTHRFRLSSHWNYPPSKATQWLCNVKTNVIESIEIWLHAVTTLKKGLTANTKWQIIGQTEQKQCWQVLKCSMEAFFLYLFSSAEFYLIQLNGYMWLNCQSFVLSRAPFFPPFSSPPNQSNQMAAPFLTLSLPVKREILLPSIAKCLLVGHRAIIGVLSVIV